MRTFWQSISVRSFDFTAQDFAKSVKPVHGMHCQATRWPVAGLVARLTCLLLAALCLGPASAWAATCTVSSTSDAAGAGTTPGTLRYCMLNYASGDTINITATGTITLTLDLPTLNNNVTISGPGANKLAINGGGSYRPFNLLSAVAVVSGVKLANSAGSAILSGATALTVSGVEFIDGVSPLGGAIQSYGTLDVYNSTFTGNYGAQGGAIYGAGTVVRLGNNTFTGNAVASGANGGAVFVSGSGTVNLTNNTFKGNTVSGGGAGAGVYLDSGSGGTLSVIANNLFAGNTGGDAIFDASAKAVSSNNLFFGNGADVCNGCLSQTSETIATADPLTFPLSHYGGPTRTFLPQPTSQALCVGSAAKAAALSLTSDQRGFAINPAYNTCAAGLVTAGSVQANYIKVTQSADTYSSNGALCPSATTCSLSDALSLAMSAGKGDISFDSSLSSVTLQTYLYDINTSGAYNIISDHGVTVATSASTNLPVFAVEAGANVLLYGLNITGANSAYGGIDIWNTGKLTVVNSTIANNNTAQGAINNMTGGSVYLIESTVANNTGFGGVNGYGTSDVTIINSTIAGNANPSSAAGVAGGICGSTTAKITLTNSIVSGNTNATHANACADYVDNGGNVIGGDTNATNNLVGGTGAAITLSALQQNGVVAAVPQTMIPLPGSPAICAGSMALNTTGLTRDEREYPLQPTSGYCAAGAIDAGAVQTNYTSAGFVQEPTDVALAAAISPAPTVNVIETDTLLPSSNTAAVNGVPVTLTYSGTGTLQNGSATTAGGLATFSSLDVITNPGANVTLGVLIPVVGVTALTDTSNSFNVVGPVTTLAVSAPLTATAGAPFSVTVTATDAAGNVITGYSGTVHFTSTDAMAVLPADYTFVAGDHGTHTFTNASTLKTAGANTFVATDTVTSSLTGNSSISVSAGAAATVAVASGNSQSATVTTAFASPLVVTVTDAFSNPVSGAAVSFNAPGSGASAVLSSPAVTNASGQTSATATANGVASSSAYTVTASTGSATSANFSLTNTQAASTTTVASNTPTNLGATATFTATVSPQAITLLPGMSITGTVQFVDGSTTICASSPVSLVGINYQATCSVTNLTAASSPHSVYAVYSGDSNFTTSTSSNTSHVVNASSTTMSITSATPATPTVDQQITVSAKVAANNGAGVAPYTSTIDILANGSPISTCTALPVDGTTGAATCTVTDAPAGTHSITARYNSGDGNYSTSTTLVPLSFTIAQVPTQVTVASDSYAPKTSQLVTLTATVTPNPSAPAVAANQNKTITGTVDFYNNATSTTVCGAVAVSFNSTTGKGSATCTTSALYLANNAHTIKATYSGDTDNVGNNGTSSAINVVKADTHTVLVEDKSALTVNDTITYTATVSINNVTPLGTIKPWAGSVTFTDTSTGAILCTNPVTMGATTATASCAVNTLNAANSPHVVKAVFNGNAEYNVSPDSNTVSAAVTKAVSNIGVASNPTTANLNAPVTLTASITPFSGSVALGGKVIFYDNSTAIGSGSCLAGGVSVNPATGVASCTTSSLNAGGHTITANYGSDANYVDSGPAVATVSVSADTSSNVALTVAPAAGSTVDQEITLTATVPFTATVPLTGSVSFTDGGLSVAGCVSTWNAGTGVATCKTSSLPASVHHFAAAYSGDTNYQPAAGTSDYTVSTAATTLALTPATSTIVVNQNITYTATLTVPTGPVVPGGSVSFTDNMTSLTIPNCASVALTYVSGTTYTATCSTASLAKGSHTITAAYSGDTNFGSSTNPAAVTVNATGTTTTLTLLPTSSVVNSVVRFTATVAASTQGTTAITGTVAFRDNGAVIPTCSGVAPSSSGTPSTVVAVCDYAGLTASPAVHSITAFYSGDTNYTVSDSTAVTNNVTVSPATTSLSVLGNSTTTTYNTPVVFTATLTYPTATLGAGVPLGGAVVFYDNNASHTVKTLIGACGSHTPNAAGIVTCNYPLLAVGNHFVSAEYTGDANFSNSTGEVGHTVTQSTVQAMTVTVPSTGTVNAPLTVMAMFVIPAGSTTPTGTMNFYEYGTNALLTDCSPAPLEVIAATPTQDGSATSYCITSQLVAGTHQIKAVYSGDSNFESLPATSTNSIVVVPANTAVQLQLPTNVVYAFQRNTNASEYTVNLAATVTTSPATPTMPTGTVNFIADSNVLCSNVLINAAGVATCTTTTLPSGSNKLTAVYSGNANFKTSSSVQQTLVVQDFSVAVQNVPSSNSGVLLTQGYTSLNDPFTPNASLQFFPTSIGTYGGTATVTCTGALEGSTSTTGAPKCYATSAGSSSTSFSQLISASGNQVATLLTIDASSSSTVAGRYIFTATAYDSATSMTRSNSFTVTIRPRHLYDSATDRTIISGSSNNSMTTSVAFVTLNTVTSLTLSNSSCVSMYGSTFSSTRTPSSLGITCTFGAVPNPSAITGTNLQKYTVPITITASTYTVTSATQMPGDGRSKLLLAGGILLPFLGLMGFARRRRGVVSVLLRMVVLAALGVAALQTMGCGGSFTATSGSTAGHTTPPGIYDLLVRGTDSNGNAYETVIEVQVGM